MVWRADGQGKPVVLKGHEQAVVSAEFSPDGAKVLTASHKTTRVWSAEGVGEPVVLRGGHGPVRSPGTRVVTASGDGAVRVWPVDGSGEPLVLTGHGDRVMGAVFSAKGDMLAIASSDGSARVWRLGVETLRERLRQMTSASLEIRQRQRYLGETLEKARRPTLATSRSVGAHPLRSPKPAPTERPGQHQQYPRDREGRRGGATPAVVAPLFCHTPGRRTLTHAPRLIERTRPCFTEFASHSCFLLSACATMDPSPGELEDPSPRLANLQRAALYPWTDDGQCVVREASNEWPILAERCFHALDRDRVRFRDVTKKMRCRLRGCSSPRSRGPLCLCGARDRRGCSDCYWRGGGGSRHPRGD